MAVHRILVADPDIQVLRYAFGALRPAGYQVLVETSPAKALSIIKVWQPDVIVVSPDRLEAWRKQEDDDAIPIDRAVVCAEVSDTNCPWLPWATQGCCILLKPLVHATQLLSAIEEVLKGSGAAQPV